MNAATPFEAALLGAMAAHAARHGHPVEHEIALAFRRHLGHPPVAGELLHQEDLATVEEYGGLGWPA